MDFLTFFSTGYCTMLERLVTPSGRWQTVPIYALCAVVNHPQHGVVVIDTGYSPRFYEATQAWPGRGYALFTPTFTTVQDSLVYQLAQRGIPAGDVKTVIITHFHGDHLCGLKDFPQAEFIYLPEAYEAVRHLHPVAATQAAFLPGLIPADFEGRSRPVQSLQWQVLPKSYAPFALGADLLGDGSLLGISLPGHAHGQMGVLVHTPAGPHLLCADACWYSTAYRHLAFPHPLSYLIHADAVAYRQTIYQLHTFHKNHPHIPISPFHCPEVVQTVRG